MEGVYIDPTGELEFMHPIIGFSERRSIPQAAEVAGGAGGRPRRDPVSWATSHSSGSVAAPNLHPFFDKLPKIV